MRAGAKPAKVSKPSRRNGSCKSAVEALQCQIARFKEAGGDRRPDELRLGLQQVMWENLLVEKDTDTLTKAKQYVADEREQLKTRLNVREPADLVRREPDCRRTDPGLGIDLQGPGTAGVFRRSHRDRARHIQARNDIP